MRPSKAESTAGGVLTAASGAWRFWFLPGWRDWLEEKGYLRPGRDFRDPARRSFNSSPRRENAWRDDGPRGARIFDKALSKIRWRDRIAVARLGGTFRGSPLLHEFRMLLAARARGLRVPAPLAAGERRRLGLALEGFLVMENLAGVPLAGWAESGPHDRLQTTRIAASAGAAVAALHRAGMSFPSMFGKHVYFDAKSDPSIGFLDLADASIHRGLPSIRVRSRDLGALAATIPRRAASMTNKLRALTAYLATLGEDPARWRTLWRRAARTAARHGSLRRNRIFASPYAPAGSTPGAPRLLTRLALPAPEAEELCKTLELLRAFGIEAPVPVARETDSGAEVLSLASPGATGDAEEGGDPGAEFGEIFARLLRAGCLPSGPVVSGIQVSGGRRLLLTVDAVRNLERPPKLSQSRIRRGAMRLIRELASHPRWGRHSGRASDILEQTLSRLL